MIGILSIILLVMWALFIFGIGIQNEYFVFIAAAGLLVLSIYIMQYGLEDVNNFVTRGLAFIQIGLGIWGVFAPVYALSQYD